MSWTSGLHPDVPIIDMCYSGIVTASELQESFYSTLNLAILEGITRIRVDCTTLSGGHSIFDLYFLADLLAMHDLGVMFKEAIVLPAMPEDIENIVFWETACVNRGLRVQLFESREEALDWLLQFP
jgi:hypothetical protein